MTTEYDGQLKQYEAQLRREEMQYEAKLRREEMVWQSQFEKSLSSDKAAVALGLLLLKSLILVNGGAIVALLTFIGARLSNRDSTGRAADPLVALILGGIELYVWGLIFGLAATVCAYFYQSTHTYVTERHLSALADATKEPTERSKTIRVWLAIGMVVLALVSLIKFVMGTAAIVGAVKL